MPDILFKTDDNIFSYRVAGICIQNGTVLLQKPTNDTAFAFPGGQVAFGETNEETLKREFKEEIGADITVSDLKWVGELFFPWGNKQCHQICLYYIVSLPNTLTDSDTDIFYGNERRADGSFKLEFHRIPLDDIKNIEVYPTNTSELIKKFDSGVQHFIYREE